MARPLSHNGLVALRLKHENPREVYAGLLWVCQGKGYKLVWCAYKFHDIFGKFPRPLTAVEPKEPSNDLREWLGISVRRWKAKKRRQEAKKR